MPDASIFSHEYRRASTLSEVLNRALLALKKKAHGIPDNVRAADQEQFAAIASAVLSSLAEQLGGQAQLLQTDPEPIQLPVEMIERLRNDRGGDLTYLIDDLRRASVALASNNLDNATLQTLEAVTAAADIEASRVFRRMIRS